MRTEHQSHRAGDGVPAGWALVPTEPTPEMESECMGLLMSEALIYERPGGGLAVETIAPVKLWAAMLAAAPTAAPAGLVPLTDYQIACIYDRPELAGTQHESGTEKAIAIARAIEAAHGIQAPGAAQEGQP